MDAKKLLDRLLAAPWANARMLTAGSDGGLAAIEHLARQAWRDPEHAWFVDPPSGVRGDATRLDDNGRARVLFLAIVAAAKVEGRLEGGQQPFIVADAGQHLSDQERDFLREQVDRPPMLDDLARNLTTRAETIEVYAASLLASDPSRPLSRHYLDMLAARLGLERALVDRIEKTVLAGA